MRKKVFWGLAILIILLVDLACVLFFLHKQAPQEAFNLFEAFFRCNLIEFNFIYNASTVQQDAEAYFFEIEGKDPPSDFMVRFAGHSTPIKKESEFVLDDFENNGLLFRIDSWKWIGWGWFTRDHAEISGGYDDRVSSYYATYTFKRDKKGWALDNVGPIAHFDGVLMPPIPSR